MQKCRNICLWRRQAVKTVSSIDTANTHTNEGMKTLYQANKISGNKKVTLKGSFGGFISLHRYNLKTEKCHKCLFLFSSECNCKEMLILLKLVLKNRWNSTFFSVCHKPMQSTPQMQSETLTIKNGLDVLYIQTKLTLAKSDILSLSLWIWCLILSRPIITDLISIFSDALKKNQNHFPYIHLWAYRV